MTPTASRARAESVAETRFAAMGSDVHVVVVGGPPDLPASARAALQLLERRWSRFRPDSEISRINAADGELVAVSTATVTLIGLAVGGWFATDGAFDPTVLDAVVAHGYDRSFAALDRRPTTEGVAADRGPAPAPGCGGVVVDTAAGTVRLPRGVSVDPGGIGKGLAADLVATMLRADGAVSALVNIGGDIRVAGAPPHGGWKIDVVVGAPGPRLALRSGAAATSSILRRQWVRGGRRRHHLIDPRTGAPSASSFASATVIAGTAWWAEVLTKALVLAESVDAAEQLLVSAAAAGMVVGRDGRSHVLAGLDRFVR